MLNFIGVDPGGSGGVALISEARAEAHSLKDVDLYWLSGYLEDLGGRESFAVIELVHAMPGNGCVSMFNFGVSFGALEAFLIASGIPYVRATPQRWQKGFGLYRKADETKTSKKNRHKSLAQELFPDLKITHATADALLIAEYARRTYDKE